MTFYAHSKENAPKNDWEPLFTPFGEAAAAPSISCSGQNAQPCLHCQSLHPDHGHLNKVAHLAATFAAEMFPEGETRETARQWGHLIGLWHDLGKYSDRFQLHFSGADTAVEHSTVATRPKPKNQIVVDRLVRLARFSRTRQFLRPYKPLFERFNPRPREGATERACGVRKKL